MFRLITQYRSRKAARKEYQKALEEFVIHAGHCEYKLDDVLPFPHKGDSVGSDGFLKQLLATKAKDDTIVGVEVWRVIQETRRSWLQRIWATAKIRFRNWQYSSIPDYIRRNRELFD